MTDSQHALTALALLSVSIYASTAYAVPQLEISTVVYEIFAKENSSNDFCPGPVPESACNTPAAGLQTSLYFNAGDFIVGSIDPDDLWSSGRLPRWSNADGQVKDLYATGSDESGEEKGILIGTNGGPLEVNGFAAPYGALVGSIADKYFLLGTDFYERAPISGTLFLHFWDSNNYDNVNSVTISDLRRVPGPQPPPVSAPAGLELLGLCLLMLLWRRHRVSCEKTPPTQAY